MAAYPGAVASFSTKQDFTVVVLAAHVNVLQAEVVAIETALGAGTSNPLPSSPVTVNDRLAALEASRTTDEQTLRGLFTALPGEVKIYTGSSAPTGYLICDGSTYTQAQYPYLYSVIGQTYGGTGTNFKVPDFRNYFLRGAGGSGGANLGAVSSGDTHNHSGETEGTSLSVNQIANHYHGIYDAGHGHPIGDPGHAHGVSDPTHGHAVSYAQAVGHTNSPPGGGGGGYAYNSGDAGNPSATGIGINGATTGVYVGAAVTGVGVEYNLFDGNNQQQAGGAPHAHVIDNNAALKPPSVTVNFIIKT